jgi:hypothetical protein
MHEIFHETPAAAQMAYEASRDFFIEYLEAKE